jgi:hypothetical protein
LAIDNNHGKQLWAAKLDKMKEKIFLGRESGRDKWASNPNHGQKCAKQRITLNGVSDKAYQDHQCRLLITAGADHMLCVQILAPHNLHVLEKRLLAIAASFQSLSLNMSESAPISTP